METTEAGIRFDRAQLKKLPMGRTLRLAIPSGNGADCNRARHVGNEMMALSSKPVLMVHRVRLY